MSDWGYENVSHSVGTAGTVSAQMLAANPDRKYALFVNDSDTVVYLAIAGAASENSGIRLTAAGGEYEMHRGKGNVNAGSITAITSADSKLVLVTEGD